jgi:HEAT repeat protein
VRDEPLRVAAALALWRIDRRPEVIPVLVEILNNLEDRSLAEDDPRTSIEVERSPGRRELAASALGEIGPDAAAALPALKRAAQNGDVFVRVAAARAVWRIERRAAPALSVLRPALLHWKRQARSAAVQALGDLAAHVPEAGVALQSALEDSEPEVRAAATVALKRSGTRPDD